MKYNNTQDLVENFKRLEQIRKRVIKLMRENRLLSEESKQLQVLSKEITESIWENYYGSEHDLVQASLLSFLDDAHYSFLAVILYGLPIKSPDAVIVKITILASLMKMLSWDGVNIMVEVPLLQDSQYRHVDGAISSVLMDAFLIPQEYIDLISDRLFSDDKFIVYATFLFIHSWLAGRPRRSTNLKGLMEKIDQHTISTDSTIQHHLEKIKRCHSLRFCRYR